jgi:hypothetical protein
VVPEFKSFTTVRLDDDSELYHALLGRDLEVASRQAWGGEPNSQYDSLTHYIGVDGIGAV